MWRSLRCDLSSNPIQGVFLSKAPIQPGQADQTGPSLSRMSPREREARLNELRKKRAEREAAMPQAQTPQPTEEIPRGVAPADFEAELDELRRRLGLAEPAVSAVDEEGCVGGSMEHSHEEGESRAEHARHIAAMEARDADEAATSHPKPAIDAAAMRRAVVMSEVLGRPRAMRKL